MLIIFVVLHMIPPEVSKRLIKSFLSFCSLINLTCQSCNFKESNLGLRLQVCVRRQFIFKSTPIQIKCVERLEEKI